jgi:alpha-glucosidase
MKPPAIARATLTLLAPLALWACGPGEPAPGSLVAGELAFAPQRHALGPFEVRLEGSGWSDARLSIFHPDGGDEPVFSTPAGEAFLEIGRGRATLRGEGTSLAVEDHVQERCRDQALDGIEAELYALRIFGRMRCSVLDRGFELHLLPESRQELSFQVRLADESFNRLALIQARDEAERFFGLGARERLGFSGFRVPILAAVRPPDDPALSLRLRAAALGGRRELGGSPVPVPVLLSSRLHSFRLDGSDYAVFDLRSSERVRVEVFAGRMSGRIRVATRPLDLLAPGSAGPAPLPEWIHAGPVLEASGGDHAVREQVARIEAAGAKLAAVRIVDAVQPDSLLELDRERYPEWEALASWLAGRGVRILLDASPRLSGEDAVAGASHVVRGADGAPLDLAGGRLVDLSDADARGWLVDRLRSRVRDGRASGLRLSGGDWLPWDALLAGDVAGSGQRNRFAGDWTRVAHRALEAAGTPVPGVVFAANATAESAAQAVVLSAGDAESPGTLSRILSAGLSGLPYAGVRVTAAQDLQRSLEFAAFVPVMRVEAEALADPEALATFVRWARVHAAWSDYRRELVRQAVETGAPLLRPLWLEHPELVLPPAVVPSAFLVGSEILVVPVLDGGEVAEVRLPQGRWHHVLTGEVFEGTPSGELVELPAPRGLPLVLHPEGSIVGERLRRELSWLRP